MKFEFEHLNDQPFDHCCTDCRFYDVDDLAFPCGICKCTAIDPKSLDYKTRYFFYVPKDEEKHDIPSNKSDPVNHPSHYTQGKIECIEAMESAFGIAKTAAYCHVNAFKYLWRTDHKNGLEDIKKAVWYLNKEVELLEKKDGETDA